MEWLLTIGDYTYHIGSFALAFLQFFAGFFGIMIVVVLWGTTEKWHWHSHKSYENAFWYAPSPGAAATSE